MAQGTEPVTWTFEGTKTVGDEANLLISGEIEPGWRIVARYDAVKQQFQPFVQLEATPGSILLGIMAGPGGTREMDSFTNQPVASVERFVTFQQKIRLKTSATTIKGTITYTLANDKNWFLIKDFPFSITLNQISIH